jgi:hypothetical protein
MGCTQKRIGLQENMIQITTCESIEAHVSQLEMNNVEELLNQRETELNEDPSQEMSHEDFIASFKHRR